MALDRRRVEWSATPRRLLLRARTRFRRRARGGTPGDRPIERTARIAIRVALAAAILGFAPGLLEPFQPFKMAIVRVVGLGLLAWVGAEAWAGRVARPGLLAQAVMLWVAANALAALFSWSPRLSLFGDLAQREGWLAVLALAGLHVAAGHAHRDARDVRGTLLVVLWSAVIAAGYAQLQLAGFDPIQWSGLHTIVVDGAVVLRPAGPLGSPLLLGVVLAVGLPLAIARMAEADSDPTRLVPATALIAASLVLTLSRGAWLAAAMGVGVAVTLALAGGARPRRVAWTMAASLAPAIVVALARAYAPLVARLAEGVEGHSAESRAIIARAALQLWSERPWLGVGPDAFGLAFPSVQDAALWRHEWVGLPAHAHAVPLQVLATTGLVGVMAGAAWIIAAAYALTRAWHHLPEARPLLSALAGAFAAVLVAGGLNVVGPAGAVLFAVCTALPDALHGRSTSGQRHQRPMHPAVPAVAAGLVCVLLLAAGARELTALALARGARDATSAGEATPSEWRLITTSRASAMWRAVAVWPHDDMLWRLTSQASLAEAAAAATAPDSGTAVASESVAEFAARRAVRLQPRRAANLACLGDVLAARALRSGHPADAESVAATYERAAVAAPADGWLLASHARFQLARRDGVRALEIAKRISGLYPDAALGHTLSGAALLLQKRPDEARAALVRARGARWEQDAGQQRAAVERLIGSLEAAKVPTRAGNRRRSRPPPPRP